MKQEDIHVMMFFILLVELLVYLLWSHVARKNNKFNMMSGLSVVIPTIVYLLVLAGTIAVWFALVN